MKSGKTLTELAGELERQSASKKDFIAPTTALTFQTSPEASVLEVPNGGAFPVTDLTHGQIAERLQIPKKYYDKMRADAPGLLDRNVNHWLQTTNERRMIRTLDGRARAFLSDRYRRLDNFDLAEAILPTLVEVGGLRVESAELTETRMYIKAVSERVTAEVVRGDVVQAGFVISNSEVGLGAVKIEPLIYRLVCLNGMIAADYSTRKYHVGRNSGNGDGAQAFEMYREETLIADDRAFFMKVRDTVAGVLTGDKFEKIVARMRESTEQKIEGDPVKAVEVLANRMSFAESERSGVLRHLIEGRDLSAYGLMNAVTRASQDVPDYDRATELEALGGQVLALPRTDWNQIAKAA